MVTLALGYDVSCAGRGRKTLSAASRFRTRAVLDGHSDADALMPHCDALLGAMGGRHRHFFPNTEPLGKMLPKQIFLGRSHEIIALRMAKSSTWDATVLAQEPQFTRTSRTLIVHRRALKIQFEARRIKATTNELLGLLAAKKELRRWPLAAWNCLN